MLALGVACALPVLAMLQRLHASEIAYGLAGFGIGFYALALLLPPLLMHDVANIVMYGGYGLMAESGCLFAAALLGGVGLLRARASWGATNTGPEVTDMRFGIIALTADQLLRLVI